MATYPPRGLSPTWDNELKAYIDGTAAESTAGSATDAGVAFQVENGTATQAATDDLVASLIPDPGTATGAALDAAIAANVGVGVESYIGADVMDPTGAINFSPILQRAINAAGDLAANIGNVVTLQVPKGTFKLDSTIEWVDNVHLAGAGRYNTTFLGPSGNVGPVFHITPLDSVRLYASGFTIDGSPASSTVYTVNLKGFSCGRALKIRAWDFRVMNTWSTGVAFDGCPDRILDGFEIINCGRGLHALGVDGLTFAYSGHAGIGDSTMANGTNWRHITRNGIIVGCPRGFFIEAPRSHPGPESYGIQLTNVWFEGNDIAVMDAGGADWQASGITMHRNRFRDWMVDKTILTDIGGKRGKVSYYSSYLGGDEISPDPTKIGSLWMGMSAGGNFDFNINVNDSAGAVVRSTGSSIWGPNTRIKAKGSHNYDGIVLAGSGESGSVSPIVGLTIEGDIRGSIGGDGVRLGSSTEGLTLTGIFNDNLGYGVRMQGTGKTVNVGNLSADVRGNDTGAWVNSHVISADTTLDMIGADTTQPSNLHVSGYGDGKVDLIWTVPIPETGITDYSVQYQTSDVGSGSGPWLDFAHAASILNSLTVTGLTNGTIYNFRVAKIDGSGTGPYTAGPIAFYLPGTATINFTSKPDQADITGTVTDTGYAAMYSQPAGSTVNVWGIQTGALRMTTITSSGNSECGFAPNTPFGKITAVVNTLASSPAGGVIVAANSGAFYSLWANGSSKTYQFRRYQGTGGVIVDQTFTGSTMAPNDSIEIDVKVNGTIDLILNGIVLYTIAAPVGSYYGVVGVINSQLGVVTFKSLTWTPYYLS